MKTETKRKLIDVPVNTIEIIQKKAAATNRSFKNYVENLIEIDSKKK